MITTRPKGKFAPAMSVYATPEQRVRLARLHEITKVPQSEIIREGLAMALDAREAELRKLCEPHGAIDAVRLEPGAGAAHVQFAKAETGL